MITRKQRQAYRILSCKPDYRYTSHILANGNLELVESVKPYPESIEFNETDIVYVVEQDGNFTKELRQ